MKTHYHYERRQDLQERCVSAKRSFAYYLKVARAYAIDAAEYTQSNDERDDYKRRVDTLGDMMNELMPENETK